MFDFKLISNEFLKNMNEWLHVREKCKVRNPLICFTLTIEQRHAVGVNLSKNFSSLFPHTKKIIYLTHLTLAKDYLFLA